MPPRSSPIQSLSQIQEVWTWVDSVIATYHHHHETFWSLPEYSRTFPNMELELTVWHVNIRNSFTVISQDTVSTSQMVAMAIPIPAVVGMMRISTFVNKTTSKGGLWRDMPIWFVPVKCIQVYLKLSSLGPGHLQVNSKSLKCQGLFQISKRPGLRACSYNRNATTTTIHPPTHKTILFWVE